MNNEIISLWQIIEKLYTFWRKNGCEPILPYENFIGAATYHPECFFNTLAGNCNKVYVQRCLRQADGRYGESPNRLICHHQMQVLLQPAPLKIKELYLESLEFIGLKIEEHDIRFIDNNWESASLGARGIGWEVLCDTMEITQFTYFQTVGDIELQKIPVELAYGLERILLALSQKHSIFHCQWSENTTYGDLFFEKEKQLSKFYLEANDQSLGKKETKQLDLDSVPQILGDRVHIRCELFCQQDTKSSPVGINLPLADQYNEQVLVGLTDESRAHTKTDKSNKIIDNEDFIILANKVYNLCNQGLYIPAYNILLDMNNVFNNLDAKGFIGEFERKNFIQQMRNSSNLIAKTFLG